MTALDIYEWLIKEGYDLHITIGNVSISKNRIEPSNKSLLDEMAGEITVGCDDAYVSTEIGVFKCLMEEKISSDDFIGEPSKTLLALFFLRNGKLNVNKHYSW